MSREKILAAARKEFADKGFEGARVDRIAASAGVNKAMLYYHFGAKERLYEAVIQELLGRIRGILRELLAAPMEPEAVLRQLAEFYVGMFESTPELRPILLREMAGGGERIRPLFTKMLTEEGATRKLQELIEQGIRDGSLRTLDPKQTLVSFLGLNLFYLLFAPLLNSVWEIKDEKGFRRMRPDAVVDLFLDGIRAQ